MMIYIAGPINGSGDLLTNTAKAIRAGEWAYRVGQHFDVLIAPFIPHQAITAWAVAYPKDPEDWQAIDDVFLDQCECLIRLPGESPGSDYEVARMEALERPVFFFNPKLRIAKTNRGLDFTDWVQSWKRQSDF